MTSPLLHLVHFGKSRLSALPRSAVTRRSSLLWARGCPHRIASHRILLLPSHCFFLSYDTSLPASTMRSARSHPHVILLVSISNSLSLTNPSMTRPAGPHSYHAPTRLDRSRRPSLLLDLASAFLHRTDWLSWSGMRSLVALAEKEEGAALAPQFASLATELGFCVGLGK